MVRAVRQGRSLRAVAREYQVSVSTVQHWVRHAEGQRLDRVDWSGRPRGGRRAPWATSLRMEDLVLRVRQELREDSALGEYGAEAIQRELRRRRVKTVPSVRTIGRILVRRGALDGQRRVRRRPPPKGWYLPPVAAGKAELDSFDLVEGLVIRGGIDVEVLNMVSLWGGLCASWVGASWTAKRVVERLIGCWRAWGLPQYVQFDNDTVFQGAHQWPNSYGRVTRLCLQLGVTVVFAPPRETGFQAAIENYNGRWQQKVWQRFAHADRAALQGCSDRFTAAARGRSAPRRDAAPARRPFPKRWQLDLQRPLAGVVVFLRRTNDRGEAELLGQPFAVDPLWPHRLVRGEVDLSRKEIRFYRLRRADPECQPLVKTVPYEPPTKPFQE